MSDWQWCVTEDWEKPAKGEKWHGAESYEDACYDGCNGRFARSVETPTGNEVRYARFVQTPNGTVIDYGSHSRFVLVRKKV